MSGISSGVGLVSGINSAAIIEQLLALEGRGKLPIQRRISVVQSAKTALMDVNARLLNLKNAASTLRTGKVFDATIANSSDPLAVTAKASASTPPGNYTFTVGRLATTSQALSRGFASRNLSPAGLDAISFEWGDAGLVRDTTLADLNGGEGVARGSIRITDRLSRSTVVDLSTAVTLNDVVEKLNGLESVAITASIENERLVIRDRTTGTASLTVEDLSGGTTANDLGIAGSYAAGVITGLAINELGASSSLARLNDGGGVLVRDGVADFRISVDGTTYDISLGREDQAISSATKLSDLRNGVGIRINTTDANDFTVVAANGTSVGINLGAVVVDGEVESEAVKTVGEMLARVNTQLDAALGAGKLTMTIRDDGKGFVLTDTTGGTGPVKVVGAGPNGEATARDLGIFTGTIDTGPTTLVGAIVRNKVATPRAATIGDVMARIATQTNNAVTASVATGGTGLTLTAASGGAISVLAGTGDGSSFGTAVSERTARDLGIFGLSGTGSVTGTRISATIGSVALSRLNGGQGIGSPGTLTLTDRAGNTVDFSDFAAHRSVESLVAAINLTMKNAGVDMKMEVDGSGRGLALSSTGDGTGIMSASGAGATALGIAASGATDRLVGTDLERQTASLGLELSALNFGKGIGKGTFRITDSSGESSIVDIDSDTVTLYDLMSEINSRGLFVEARMNATGDGILLVDTNGSPASKLKIEDVSGSIARSLGIVGEATAPGASITGSFERSVDLDTTDTLDDIVRKINAAGIPVGAAVINSGSGATPFRLSLSSGQGGSAGQLWIDTGGVDLGFMRAVDGKDATLFLGSGSPETSFLFTSSSNTFKDVVSGLEVTALKAGATVQVDVARDEAGMINAVKQFVTTVNDALGRIRDYDKYDIETKKKGPLLGNSTVAQVRQQIIQAAQGPAKGVDGRYRFLSQVGIRFGKNGELVMDEEKFKAAYATDPQAVEDLFTAFEVRATTTSSSIPGVTVENTTTSYAKLGFGDLFDQVLKKLTNSVDGVTTLADRNFQKQIEELNTRLDRYDQRLTSKRQRLEAQFAGMEAALARLQAQQGSLGSIMANMGIMG